MHYTNIVFDIDGTLINSNYALLHSLQDAIKLYNGKNFPLEQLSFSIGLPANVILKTLGISDMSYVDALWEQCYQKYISKISPFEGIENILKVLYRKEYILGIITSKTRSEYQKEFEIFHIHKYFQYSVCLDECTNAKPSPKPLYQYMKISNSISENVLYIGDSNVDMKCAQSACVDFAFAKWGATQHLWEARYYLETPDDLLRILEDEE